MTCPNPRQRQIRSGAQIRQSRDGGASFDSPAVVPRSAEFCFGMNSGETPASAPRSRRCLPPPHLCWRASARRWCFRGGVSISPTGRVASGVDDKERRRSVAPSPGCSSARSRSRRASCDIHAGVGRPPPPEKGAAGRHRSSSSAPALASTWAPRPLRARIVALAVPPGAHRSQRRPGRRDRKAAASLKAPDRVRTDVPSGPHRCLCGFGTSRRTSRGCRSAEEW
jgi:hypothetical protein